MTESRPKSRIRRFLWIAVLLLIAIPVVIVGILLFNGGKRPYRISEETTFLTGPLVDGHIDYVAALNAELSAGVTPENNAAVMFLRATGLAELPDGSGERSRFFEQLGIAPLPEEGRYLVTLRDFSAKHAGTDLDGQFEKARSAAWSPDECPALAEWVNENHEAAELIIAGTARSHYYLPILTDPADPASLDWVALPAVTENRAIARLLLARAALALGEDDLATARRNLLACHRHARLISGNPTGIGSLVAIACESLAVKGDVLVLQHADLSKEEALEYRDQLRALPAMVPAGDKVDLYVRFMFLERATAIADDRVSEQYLDTWVYSEETIDEVARVLPTSVVDWNVVLRNTNKLCDDAAAAWRIEDRTKRDVALGKVADELNRIDSRGKSPGLGSLVASPGKVMTDHMLWHLIGSMRFDPAVRDNNAMRMQLVDVALSLAAHRAEHGVYPQALSDLVPAYLDEIPEDLFVGKPLHYKRSETGYLLYSVGTNKIDQGGQSRGMGFDDIVIRTPPSDGERGTSVP